MSPIQDLKHYLPRERNGSMFYEHRHAIGREVIWIDTVLVLVALFSAAGPTIDWWMQ